MYPFPPAMVNASRTLRWKATRSISLRGHEPPRQHRQRAELPAATGSPIALTVEPEQYVVVETRQPKRLKSSRVCVHFAQKPSKVTVGVNVPSAGKRRAGGRRVLRRGRSPRA